MHNEEERTPRRRPMHGPGPRGAGEKAKDFKSAIKRLVKELNPFKVLICISLFLAVLGSILSICTPNILSDLTDEISKGLVVNTKNMKNLTKEVTTNMQSEETKKRLQEVLNIRMDQEVITKIMQDETISIEDKIFFQKQMEVIASLKNRQEVLGILSTLPDSILEKLVQEEIIGGQKITSKEKLDLMKSLNNPQDIAMSSSIADLVLTDIEINHVKVVGDEQIDFIHEMSSMDKDSDVNALY